MRVTDALPSEVTSHLPAGYAPVQGVWFVLPAGDGDREIEGVNRWLRAEEWYPRSLEHVIWFGDDGTGNFFGWDPRSDSAILWNPEDGEEPWKTGSVPSLWQFVQNGYQDAT